jgi:hypothetical protein
MPLNEVMFKMMQNEQKLKWLNSKPSLFGIGQVVWALLYICRHDESNKLSSCIFLKTYLESWIPHVHTTSGWCHYQASLRTY